MKHPLAEPKWTLPEIGASTRIARELIMQRISANLEKMEDGSTWRDVVSAQWQQIFSAEDAKEVESDIFSSFVEQTGRKYYASSDIAHQEAMDRYIMRTEARVYLDPADYPDDVIGDGHNVFSTPDVTGTVTVIGDVNTVHRLLDEGVPEGSIAVIDDSGGTLTAPIIPDFDAVICLAGTVRSHLAIIAREFGIPTFMAARLTRPLKDGERVTLASSGPAQDVDAYLGEDMLPPAHIRIAE